MSNNLKKKNYGFTLVETLVAISILSLSILASFTAVQGGLQSSTFAKDQITAFFLVQEAMEFIKNVRDENALNSLDGSPVTWLTGMAELAGDPCYFGKTCIIDSPLKTLSNPAPCGPAFGSCQNIRQDPVTGLFGYTGSWTETRFKREIQFQNIASDEVRVIISISWVSRGTTKSFQISQLLFDRQ